MEKYEIFRLRNFFLLQYLTKWHPKAEKKLRNRPFFDIADRHEKLYGRSRLYASAQGRHGTGGVLSLFSNLSFDISIKKNSVQRWSSDFQGLFCAKIRKMAQGSNDLSTLPLKIHDSSRKRNDMHFVTMTVSTSHLSHPSANFAQSSRVSSSTSSWWILHGKNSPEIAFERNISSMPNNTYMYKKKKKSNRNGVLCKREREREREREGEREGCVCVCATSFYSYTPCFQLQIYRTKGQESISSLMNWLPSI